MSDWEIQGGDVLERLREMPTGSVHAVVTSPPYFGLRDYGIPGQIGLEATPEAFIARMVEVFREVRRVLRHDGTCWVNMGDSYAGSGPSNSNKTFEGAASTRRVGPSNGKQPITAEMAGLKPKDLMMMPARVALALQADGWWLRSEITWCKRAPMPESVTDRPTSATEKIYLLTKSARYYYDSAAVREKSSGQSGGRFGTYPEGTLRRDSENMRPLDSGERNLWNYWLLSPEAFPSAHFATFPTEIPRRAILAGTSERGACAECGAPWRRVVVDTPEYAALKAAKPWTGGGSEGTKSMTEGYGGNKHASATKQQTTTGWQPTCRHTDAPTVPCTVLDPFSGAGTTVMVALRLGRRAVGIELNPEYVAMSRERIIGDAPMFNTPLEQSA